MNDFWYTAVFSSLVIASGIYTGWNFFKYLYDEDGNERTRGAFKAFLGFVSGVLICITSFVAFDTKGDTRVDTRNNGAYKMNEAAPEEPTKEELKRDAENKRKEERGESSEKSYEEIREESNQVIQEKLENHERNN